MCVVMGLLIVYSCVVHATYYRSFAILTYQSDEMGWHEMEMSKMTSLIMPGPLNVNIIYLKKYVWTFE
jgi:hypothetical protein